LAATLLVTLGCATLPPGRSAIDSVSILGTEHLDSNEMAERIVTTPSPKFLGLFRGLVYDYTVFDDLVLARDVLRLERYCHARGFYEAKVRAGRVLKQENGHVKIEIEVEEGSPTQVGSVVVEGTEPLPERLAHRMKALAARRLKDGAPFDESVFQGTEDALLHLLTDNGYARAKVSRDAVVDRDRHTATIVFGLSAGPPSTFGPVFIEGLSGLPEKPVLRAASITPGQPYTGSAIESARQALLDLGVFTSVEVTPELDQASGPESAVPIRVKVEPAKLRTVRLGAGAEFDSLKTDLHVMAGWEDDNFLGGLRRYRVSLKPGLVLYPLRTDNWVSPSRPLPEFRLENELRQPGFLEARTSGFLRADLNLFPVLLGTNPNPSDPVPGYLEPRMAVGVDRAFGKLYVRLTQNVQIEKPIAYGGPVDDTLRTIAISYPELVTNLDFSDSRLRPHKGVFVSNTFQVAGGIFGGDAADIAIQPDVRTYVSIGRRVTFATRAGVGLLFPSNYGASIRAPGTLDVTSLTRDLQLVYFRGLFAGGPNSDRGYPIRGIAPHELVPAAAFGGPLTTAGCSGAAPDPANCSVPVGGFTRWEASVEFRFNVTGSFSMATFCDAADVSAAVATFRFTHPHVSCGLGARYDTPVGPIRADLGYRIPGLQILKNDDPSDQLPASVLGIPIALAVGIGEAF
jgi:outer membrane protein assembly factor BamA